MKSKTSLQQLEPRTSSLGPDSAGAQDSVNPKAGPPLLCALLSLLCVPFFSPLRHEIRDDRDDVIHFNTFFSIPARRVPLRDAIVTETFMKVFGPHDEGILVPA
jgi:hypothetical protein